MKKIANMTAAAAMMLGVLLPVTVAADPTVAAHAATPDIVCNTPTWWYDEQTRQFINDNHLSGDGYYSVPSENNENVVPYHPDAIEMCGDYPYDQIWYIRVPVSQVFPDNALGVQLQKNSVGGTQGPILGYNYDPVNCAEWFDFCPVVAGEYPFGETTEWAVRCYSGFPGYVSFQSYYTGLYMTVGTNPEPDSGPANPEFYEGAGIAGHGAATVYIVPGLCGTSPTAPAP